MGRSVVQVERLPQWHGRLADKGLFATSGLGWGAVFGPRADPLLCSECSEIEKRRKIHQETWKKKETIHTHKTVVLLQRGRVAC